jgi:branched-chain amino acid aminotransferase
MSVVWFNGELFEDSILIDPADRGLMLGDGLFETIAVIGGNPVWANEHLARMSLAAEELGLGFGEAQLRIAIEIVLKRSSAPGEVMRITLTRGVTPRGLAAPTQSPSLMVSLLPFDSAKQPQAITLATAKIKRNQWAPSSRHKTLSYIDNVAAAREVVGRADDALMENTEGYVACSTVGNVFLWRGAELITPQDDQGVLCGITRAKILKHAQEFGLRARQAIVTRDEIYSADAVFLTNSLRLVTPVTKLDDRPLGTKSVQHIKDYLKGLSP